MQFLGSLTSTTILSSHMFYLCKNLKKKTISEVGFEAQGESEAIYDLRLQRRRLSLGFVRKVK